MKYDDASWHYGGEFPADQPQEHGATHIALFLRWCFCKGWVGELHTDDTPQAVADVISGQLSATEFFFRYCDGKLTDEDLNEAGNAFARLYYGPNGLYLDDYSNALDELLYCLPESAHDFQSFSAMLDARLISNVLTVGDEAATPE